MMQAVILAAGKGTRLKPLTHTIPKPLLKIKDQAIIEYNLKELPKEISEVIIVVGHLGEEIKKYLGDSFQGKRIKYIKQNKQLGTAHALQICNKYLRGKFLVLMGDNIYNRKDIKKCLRHNLSILVYEQTENFSGNEVVTDNYENFVGLKKVTNKKKCLVNTGLYLLDKSFFDYDLVRLESSEEYGLPQTLVSISQKFPIKVEKTKKWIQINNHEDLKLANKILSI